MQCPNVLFQQRREGKARGKKGEAGASMGAREGGNQSREEPATADRVAIQPSGRTGWKSRECRRRGRPHDAGGAAADAALAFGAAAGASGKERAADGGALAGAGAMSLSVGLMTMKATVASVSGE